MMELGLLNEVLDVYNPTADYTRGLRQAIGVREFEEFCATYLSSAASGDSLLVKSEHCDACPFLCEKNGKVMVCRSWKTFEMTDKHQNLLNEAVGMLKTNTRRLVRRQVRRLKRLQSLFGWKLNYVDATHAFECNEDAYWISEVVEPSVSIVNTFLCNKISSVAEDPGCSDVDSRNLWSCFVCEACDGQVLRGAHEWEQHKQGRRHRKRVSHLRKKLDGNAPWFNSEPSATQPYC